MIEINPLVVILLAEATAALLFTLLVWCFISLRRNGRDKRAVRALIERVRAQKDERTRLRSEHLERAGLAGERLGAALADIERAEREFLRAFIRCYRERNPAMVENFLGAMDSLTAPRPDAAAPTAASSDAPAAAGEVAAENETAPVTEELVVTTTDEVPRERIAELESENEKLAEELRITRDTLDSMLEEYASMFASGNGEEPGDVDEAREGGASAASGSPREGGSDGTEPVVASSRSTPLPARAQADAN